MNAFKELAGGIQTGATQVGGSRGALPETIHETSRASNAKLRNSNLNLIPIELDSKPWNVLDKGMTWSDLPFRKPQYPRRDLGARGREKEKFGGV